MRFLFQKYFDSLLLEYYFLHILNLKLPSYLQILLFLLMKLILNFLFLYFFLPFFLFLHLIYQMHLTILTYCSKIKNKRKRTYYAIYNINVNYFSMFHKNIVWIYELLLTHQYLFNIFFVLNLYTKK